MKRKCRNAISGPMALCGFNTSSFSNIGTPTGSNHHNMTNPRRSNGPCHHTPLHGESRTPLTLGAARQPQIPLLNRGMAGFCHPAMTPKSAHAPTLPITHSITTTPTP